MYVLSIITTNKEGDGDSHCTKLFSMAPITNLVLQYLCAAGYQMIIDGVPISVDPLG